MNKKDIKLIIGLLIVAVVGFFGFKWYKDSQGPDVIGVVQHGNEIILAFEIFFTVFSSIIYNCRYHKR